MKTLPLVMIAASLNWWDIFAAIPTLAIQGQGSNAMVNFTGQLLKSEQPEGPYQLMFNAANPYLWQTSNAPQMFWRARMTGASTFAAGTEHTVALQSDGTLWSWGLNDHGQLGNGNSWNTNVPTRIGADNDWVAVACGWTCSAALKADGSLWTWGGNDTGQLGNGTFDSTNEPVHVAPGRQWRAAALGFASAVAVGTDGSLWAWGHPGLGSSGNTNRPAQVGSDRDWLSVACGGSHIVALRTNGTLWAWGDNNAGQLGLGVNDPRVSQPTQVGTDTDWTLIVCGTQHTLTLKKDGSLWAWGYGSHGQLGTGSSDHQNRPTLVLGDVGWVTVAAGYGHAGALSSDGGLWTWGANRSGQLGFGGNPNGTNQPTRVGSDADWEAVACGGFENSIFQLLGHTVARKADGSLWAWGRNNSGQLGNGTFVSTNRPARVPSGTNWAR